jgi:hypothetical protein
MQLALPLMERAEIVERRAYFEAKTGDYLGRHRRRRYELGQGDKLTHAKTAAAVQAGINKANRVSD